MSVGSGKPSAKTQRHARALRELALAFPETHEDHPWGHSAFKVKTKAFLFTAADEHGLNASLKLVASHAAALALPYVEPTGYGLGKHGWITASFGPSDDLPLAQLEEWISESFRAVAPKTILKRLDLPPPVKPTKTTKTAKRAKTARAAKKTRRAPSK